MTTEIADVGADTGEGTNVAEGTPASPPAPNWAEILTSQKAWLWPSGGQRSLLMLQEKADEPEIALWNIGKTSKGGHQWIS